MGKHRKWWPRQACQRACSRCLRSVGSMFVRCEWSAPQSAHLRTTTIAWLSFSASKMIFKTKYHSSNRIFACVVIFVFSFPSSIVSWIRLKWCVKTAFILILSTKQSNYSIRDGLNTGTETFTKIGLMRPRKSHMNALMHAPLTSSSSSSIDLSTL